MIFFLSLALDILLGDPPNHFHPTAWMGNLIRFLMRFRPRGNKRNEFLFGIFILLIGISLTMAAGFGILYLASFLPLWAGGLLQAASLKLTISLRGLDRAAKEVQHALDSQDLPEARRLLSWHLVSRDTAQLNEAQISAAAIESVAENASDGIVAPLFFTQLAACLPRWPIALSIPQIRCSAIAIWNANGWGNSLRDSMTS